jgi:hypothetical protein
MKLLWAPWRSTYVEKIDQTSGCFLCDAVDQPEEKLGIIWCYIEVKKPL